MNNKKVVNIFLPSGLIKPARQAAFEQGYIYKGEGNLSAWVADLINKEIKQNERTTATK